MDPLTGVVFLISFLFLMLAIGGWLLKLSLRFVAGLDTTIFHAMVSVLIYAVLAIIASLMVAAMIDGTPQDVEIVSGIVRFIVAASVIKMRYELNWRGGLLTALVLWLLSLILGLLLVLLLTAVGLAAEAAVA